MHELKITTFGPHACTLVRQIYVFDVEAEHLGGGPGGLVAEAPECALAHGHVLTSPQPLELGARDGLRAVGWLTASVETACRILRQPAVSATKGDERADRGDMAIPGGRCAVAPCLIDRGLDLGVADCRQRLV